jgi:hypothetical protein
MAAAQQRTGVRQAADALTFERRLLLWQIRDLERLMTDRDREIGRRYTILDQYLPTIPAVDGATAPAISVAIGRLYHFRP